MGRRHSFTPTGTPKITNRTKESSHPFQDTGIPQAFPCPSGTLAPEESPTPTSTSNTCGDCPSKEKMQGQERQGRIEL